VNADTYNTLLLISRSNQLFVNRGKCRVHSAAVLLSADSYDRSLLLGSSNQLFMNLGAGAGYTQLLLCEPVTSRLAAACCYRSYFCDTVPSTG
jgi:hypothetical protein